MLTLAAAAGLCACYGPTYKYAPDTTNAVTSGLPATRVGIPQEAPQGAVEVASYGIARVDERLPALHIRMIVTNDGDDTPWRVDTRQQLIEIPGEGRSRALYVNTDVRTLPIVEIPRHVRRVFDMFFPLPTTASTASRIPQFSLLWEVDTAARTVSSRSDFQRYDENQLANNESYSGYYGGYESALYWGPYWWYDPFWPTVAFVHRPFFHGHVGAVGIGRFHGGFHAHGGFHGGGHVAHGGGRR